MTRWFRLYADAMRSPKVAALSDREFRLWVQLLAAAAENDGKLPAIGDLKHILKSRLDHLLTGVERLISAGLIDRLEVGYEPHNWSKFQYKSDTSTVRVTKYRQKRNVSETVPEAETDTEPPRPPKGGEIRRRDGKNGASKIIQLGRSMKDGNEGSREGFGGDRPDACRLPQLAISDH